MMIDSVAVPHRLRIQQLFSLASFADLAVEHIQKRSGISLITRNLYDLHLFCNVSS